MALDLVVFFAYLLVLIAISVWSARFMKDIGDFLLAGRRLGPWVSSFSSTSSLATGYTYTAAPGVAFSMGWASMWYTVPEAFASVLNFAYLGRRVRRMSQLMGSLTVPDFLYRRTGHQSVRLSSALIVIVFISVYTAVQFSAAGLIMQGAFGLDYTLGVVLTAAAMVVVLLLGGYLAASLTDFFQAILMWGGTIMVVVLGLVHVGGLGALNDQLAATGEHLVTVFRPDFGPFDALAVFVGFGVGLIGLPHILVRLYSMQSDRIAGKAAVRNGIYWTVFGQCYFGLGLLALVIVGQQAVDNPERSGILLWNELLPAGLLGLMVSAAIAAVFSSAESFLMVLAGTVMRDLLQPYLLRNADQRTLVRLSRLVVVCLAIIGAVIAIANIGSIFSIVVFAVGAAGVAFGIPHVFAVFWRRLTWQGLLAGQLLGMGTYVGLEVAGARVPVVFGVSVPLTAAVIVLVSLLTFRGMTPAMEEIFERTRRYDELTVGEGEDLEGVGLPRVAPPAGHPPESTAG